MYMPQLGSKKLSYSDNMKRMRKASKKANKKATIKEVNKIVNKKIGQVIESKTWNANFTGDVGQLNENGSGHWSGSLMSGMTQGDDNGEYEGRSYKPKRYEMSLQFWKQTNTRNSKYIKLVLVKFKDQTPGADFNLENCFNSNEVIADLNTGVNVYDPLCFRNNQQGKNYSVCKEMNFMVPSGLDTQNQIKTVHFNYTFPKNYVQQMDVANPGRPFNSDYRMLIFCDSGNRSGTASTLDTESVSVLSANSGLNFAFNRKLHYLDA